MRAREWARLSASVPDGAAVVSCDERGAGMSSEAFATWLSARFDSGHAVAFVIGVTLTLLAFLGLANAAVLIATAALFGISYAIAKPALSSMVPALVPKQA